jgi:hypothetical protein
VRLSKQWEVRCSVSGVGVCERDAVMRLLLLLSSYVACIINSLLLLCMCCYLLTGVLARCSFACMRVIACDKRHCNNSTPISSHA